MFIPRELGIHKCHGCGAPLVDDCFKRCGIYLDGERKWQVYYIYECRGCSHGGGYSFAPRDGDLPGDMFRDFAHALDAKYIQDNGVQSKSLDEFLKDHP